MSQHISEESLSKENNSLGREGFRKSYQQRIESWEIFFFNSQNNSFNELKEGKSHEP